MSDDFMKHMQRIWAEVGGLGPAPVRLVNCFDSRAVTGQTKLADHTRAFYLTKAGRERHALRMRMVESALTGTCNDRASVGTVANAFALADAVLARLDAEAKGAAGGPVG